MKCILCGNIVPDNSTSCPYCGANLANANNTNDINSSLPTTPIAPVLPNDQVITPGVLEPAAHIDGGVTPETQAIPVVNTEEVVTQPVPTSEVAQVSTPTVTEPVISTPEVVNPSVPAPEVAPVQPSSVVVNTVAPVSVMPSAPVSENVVSNSLEENRINAKGEIDQTPNLDQSVKIGTSLETEDTTVKKKNKKTLLIVGIVVFVILVIGGLGYGYYYSQYKTDTKRITAVLDGFKSLTRSYTNEYIEKTSGTYKIEGTYSSDSLNLNAKADGTYARDLSAKKLDLTLNVQDLVAGEKLIDKPLNMELYYGDSNLYVLFENFYNQYIYQEYPELKNYFDAIEQNDIDYQVIINGTYNAILSGVLRMSRSSSVGSATINGQTKTCNIITIKVNSVTQKNFLNGMIFSMTNNENFLSEVSKILGIDAEKLKGYLESIDLNKIKFKEVNGSINIYTSMFKEEFFGIKANINGKKSYTCELFQNGAGYAMNIKEDNQKVFDFKYNKSIKNTSTTVEKTYDVDLSLYKNNKANSVKGSVEVITDLKPKDVKVNVKNSVKLEYLSDEVKQEILTKSQSVGTLGLYLPDVLKGYLYPKQELMDQGEVNPPVENPPVDSCGMENAC